MREYFPYIDLIRGLHVHQRLVQWRLHAGAGGGTAPLPPLKNIVARPPNLTVHLTQCGRLIFTARCYASAVLAMALCLSVRPSVCPSQAGVLQKRQNVGSHKQNHTIHQGLCFSDAKDLREIRWGSPPTGRQMHLGWVKIGDFRQITGYISKTVQDRRMVSIKVE